MRLSWHPIARQETDHELIWLCVSLGGAGAAASWLALHLPWPRCAFHALTGFPCLTCGATRSAVQFFQGHFVAAWHLNPLAFAAYCGIAIFDVYAATVLLTHAPRLRLTSCTSIEKLSVRLLFIGLLVANWVHQLHAGI